MKIVNGRKKKNNCRKRVQRMAKNINDEVEGRIENIRLEEVRDKKEKVNWSKDWSKKENRRSDQF